MLRMALIEGNNGSSPYRNVEERIRNGRFTAIAAHNLRTARDTANLIGAEIYTDSFHELLTEHGTAFDAVVINSPNRFKNLYCQRSAESGKHILTNAPLALSKESALEIINACQEAGVSLQVTQDLRFLPSLQTVKKSLVSGQIGDPGLLRIHSWKKAIKYDGKKTLESIRKVVKERLLLSEVTREIDVACWLFNNQPNVIYAVEGKTVPPECNGSAYIQLHLGFKGGGMALIDYSQTLPQGDDYYSLSMIGSTGAVYADDHRNMQLLYKGGNPSALKVGEGENYWILQLQEFINSIEENRSLLLKESDVLRVIEIAEAVAVSLETGEAVQMDAETLDEDQ